MTTDKQLLKKRFAATFRQYDSLAVVQQEICGQLDEMIGRICPGRIGRAMEVGCGTGFLTHYLLRRYPDAEWIVNDLIEESEIYLRPYASGHYVEYLWGDAELLPLPGELDMIASASAVQWFDNLPLFIDRAVGSLCCGGYFAFTTFGTDNFREIRATTGEGLHYYTSEQLQELLTAAGYGIVETLEYTRHLPFDTPADVLRHIKATGVNSIRTARWGKQQLMDFETAYREHFSMPDGRVALTYHPILVLAQKK